MAILRSEHLVLEVTYGRFDGGYIRYDFTPSWQGKPIFNEALWKEEGVWGPRPPGVVQAEDYGGCGILATIERVLKTGESSRWPSIVAYADLAFEVFRYAANGAKRGDGDPLASDHPIAVALDIDTDAFIGEEGCSGCGVSVRLIVTRADLERFREDLRGEYERFRQTYNIDAWLDAMSRAERYPPKL